MSQKVNCKHIFAALKNRNRESRRALFESVRDCETLLSNRDQWPACFGTDSEFEVIGMLEAEMSDVGLELWQLRKMLAHFTNADQWGGRHLKKLWAEVEQSERRQVAKPKATISMLDSLRSRLAEAMKTIGALRTENRKLKAKLDAIRRDIA